jgi:hypothetical protein
MPIITNQQSSPTINQTKKQPDQFAVEQRNQRNMNRQLPVVRGSKGGNAALASLINALSINGIIKDQTT